MDFFDTVSLQVNAFEKGFSNDESRFLAAARHYVTHSIGLRCRFSAM